MTHSKASAAARSQEPPTGNYLAVREDGEYLARWNGRWRLTSDSAEAAKLTRDAAVAAVCSQVSPAEQECWWVCPAAFVPACPAEHPFILLHNAGVMLTRNDAGAWGTTWNVLLAAHLNAQEAEKCLSGIHPAEGEALCWRMVSVEAYLHPRSVSQAEIRLLVARVSGAAGALARLQKQAQTDAFCCTALCRNAEHAAAQHGLSVYPSATPEACLAAKAEREAAQEYLRRLLAQPLGEVTVPNTNPYVQIEKDLGK